MYSYLLGWCAVGALLTMFMPIPANKKMFWIQSIIGGMALWVALGIFYLLRRYGGMEFEFWRGE